MNRVCFALALMFLSWSTAVAAPLEAQTTPKIISTSPATWAVNVDPSLKRIFVNFDQVMLPAFTDWIGRSSIVPALDLDSSIMSADQKGFELKISAERAKVYVFALNEKGLSGVGFQNKAGISARPFYLVFQTAGNLTKEEAPPRVVITSPANLAQGVNPKTATGISITFDKGMNVKTHGLHLFESKQAVSLKNVRFSYSADGRTFTLNYPLKAMANYEVQLNGSEDIGFASINRVPLWPYHFAFTTGQPR
jgi:Bacterial Ig-like domain